MSALSDWLRPELRTLVSALPRADGGDLRLDANEVPWRPPLDSTEGGLNRYPPARAEELGERLAEIYGVAPGAILVTRGSDEGIDLLVRAFCRPGVDAVLTLPPTFGMYAHTARIQGAPVVECARLRADDFAIDFERLESSLDGVRLLFVANPDNPTGRALTPEELDRLLRLTAGRALLVIDEAYIEFSPAPSASGRLGAWRHLVVLRTLSKAHALAGARCGALIAAPEMVALIEPLLPPYAITRSSIEAAMAQLTPRALRVTGERIARLIEERERLARDLRGLSAVKALYPSAANFLLVAFEDRRNVLTRLADAGIAVRSFDDLALVDCLRITVGTQAQNHRLIAVLAER